MSGVVLKWWCNAVGAFVDIPENVIRDALKVLLSTFLHHRIDTAN